MKYPPLAATVPMETMTGRSVLHLRNSSRITSEAWPLPPGLLTRSTTAFTSLRWRISRIMRANRSPATWPVLRPPDLPQSRPRHKQRRSCLRPCRSSASPSLRRHNGDGNLRERGVILRLARQFAQFVQGRPFVSKFRDQAVFLGGLGTDQAVLVHQAPEAAPASFCARRRRN